MKTNGSRTLFQLRHLLEGVFVNSHCRRYLSKDWKAPISHLDDSKGTTGLHRYELGDVEFWFVQVAL